MLWERFSPVSDLSGIALAKTEASCEDVSRDGLEARPQLSLTFGVQPVNRQRANRAAVYGKNYAFSGHQVIMVLA
jgi:hypothetical protein